MQNSPMIYLHEVVECLPGKTDEYIDFVEQAYLPYADQQDISWLNLCGLWKPRTSYGKWSQAVLLYQVTGWKQWLNYFGQRDPAERERFYKEFYTPALQLRSGWFDRLIIALPYSPRPPVRPATERTGAQFIDQRIDVKPDGIAQFMAAMRDIVVPAAQRSGLRLELAGRVMMKPSQFQFLWSLTDVNKLADWRQTFDVDAVAPSLPSFEAAWSYLLDFEERDLIPSYTSPLGGTHHNAGQKSGVTSTQRTSSLSSE